MRLKGVKNGSHAEVLKQNIENIEELYDIVSEMAAAMLDLEIERLAQR